MAKKKEDTKKKGAKEKDPEKEAKRKARMEAIKNRPADIGIYRITSTLQYDTVACLKAQTKGI